MTRDTKLGLLVGLAFIILIGILLSDHLTSSTEPPAAALAQTGNSVRQTVTNPGGTQLPVTPVTAPPVSPERTVLTNGDLDNQAAAQAIVRVGGPAAPQTSRVQTPAPPSQTTETPIAAAPRQGAPTPASPASDQPMGELARIAHQIGESLVTVPSGGSQSQPVQASARLTGNSTSGMAEYTAQPGDSLSKIASKQMGSSSKANIDAIIAANPTLAADPNKIIAGRSYKIPSAASVAQAPAAQPPTQIAAAPTIGSTEYWYTVKEGDTLTRIVREQLGQDATAIPSLVELNRDVLKQGDKIFPNMKIRLPGKPMAQAN